ncbi:hypothetical protein DK26_06140 [Bosea sp. WAO]|nr:hypothetical protein DK26_06140 [Bosea sp. WAO]
MIRGTKAETRPQAGQAMLMPPRLACIIASRQASSRNAAWNCLKRWLMPRYRRQCRPRPRARSPTAAFCSGKAEGYA